MCIQLLFGAKLVAHQNDCTSKLKEASTHRSAKTHAGDVTRDLDL